MTLFTRRPGADPVDLKKLKTIVKVGSVEYVEHGGQEYALAGSTVDHPDDLSPGAGSLIVSVPTIAREGGRELVIGAKFRAASPVENGTGLKLDAERKKRTDHAPRKLADVLSPLGALRGARPMVLPSPGATQVGPPKGLGAYVDGRQAARGRAILAALERQGVTLQVHAGTGRLLVTDARNNLRNDLRDVIERAEPLLLGWLTNKPAACQLTHSGAAPEAWTVLVGGLLACESHANGELRP